jgi:multidrug efflux pump subunit AcrB
MPTGTKVAKTQEVILEAEKLIKKDKRVNDFATFVGTSAPRFYYNFAPEVPTTNYGIILVNTTNEKTAEELSEELREKVKTLTTEGTFFVKLMQQGSQLIAPVEVRIVGEDIAQLKNIGSQVESILKKSKGSFLVRNDFAEDSYGIDIKVKKKPKSLVLLLQVLLRWFIRVLAVIRFLRFMKEIILSILYYA